MTPKKYIIERIIAAKNPKSSPNVQSDARANLVGITFMNLMFRSEGGAGMPFSFNPFFILA